VLSGLARSLVASKEDLAIIFCAIPLASATMERARAPSPNKQTNRQVPAVTKGSVRDSRALACQRNHCCIRQVPAETKVGVRDSMAMLAENLVSATPAVVWGISLPESSRTALSAAASG